MRRREEADRPPRAGLPDAGRLSADLHAHTDHSPDCLSAPAEVIRAARRAGLSRIAITDHDRIGGALEAKRRAPELVIVGEEVRTREGPELIGLFLKEHIVPGAPFREVAARIRGQGGVTYLPHPFDRSRGADGAFLDRVADCVDAVEAFNARVHDRSANRRAAAWAARHAIPVGAGSDAHLLSEIGRGRVLLPPFRGAAEFAEVLRAGRIEGRTSGRWVHLGSTWAKVRKSLPFLTGRRLPG